MQEVEFSPTPPVRFIIKDGVICLSTGGETGLYDVRTIEKSYKG